MIYIEHKPDLPLRRFVRSLWYANAPFVQHPARAHPPERMCPDRSEFVARFSHGLPGGRAGTARRTSPHGRPTFESTRSLPQPILLTWPACFLNPVPCRRLSRIVPTCSAIKASRWIKFGPASTDTLRARMLAVFVAGSAASILEDCLATVLIGEALCVHPAVEFALQQCARDSNRLSIADLRAEQRVERTPVLTDLSGASWILT